MARAYNRMPHELGRLPVTYYQTLVNHLLDQSKPTSSGEGGVGDGGTFRSEDVDDEGRVVDVNVDDLIRQGRVKGIGR